MTGRTTAVRLAYDGIGFPGDFAPEPLGIAGYPKVGKLFWTNVKSFASIFSAGMDGSRPVTVIDTGLEFPNGIAIDFENSRLYWADVTLGTLETRSL